MTANVYKPVFALVLALAGGVAGMAWGGENGAFHRSGEFEGSIDYGDEPVPLTLAGKALMLRHDRKGTDDKMIVREIDTGAEHVVAGTKDNGAKNSSASLYADREAWGVIWRPKLSRKVEGLGTVGDKFVFARQGSADQMKLGEPQRLNLGAGAFAPYVVNATAGDVHVAWTDERDGTAYQIYYNVSHDHGKTWKSGDRRMNAKATQQSVAGSVSLVGGGDDVWMAWIEKDAAGFDVNLRHSADRGENWSEPQLIYHGEALIQKLQFFKVKQRLCAYWLTREGVIDGRCGTGADKTWQAIQAPNADGPKVVLLKGAVDDTGVLHLVFGVKPDDPLQENIYYSRSEDGTMFSSQHRLNNTPEFKVRASLFNVAVNGDGAIMVVWQDNRAVRRSIWGNLSRDHGLTWLKNDIPLSDKIGGLSSIYPNVAPTPSGFLVTWMEFDDHLERTGRSVLRKVNQSDAHKISIKLDQPDQQLLEKRVQEYWNMRVKGDWKAAYEFLDPFIRAQLRVEAYIGSQGVFKYYDAKFHKAEFDGNKANVETEVTYELPKTRMGRGEIFVPKKTEPLPEQWIWVDNNWYVVYKDLYNQDWLPK